MKIWTSEHTFPHPWRTVVQAAWRKYPNPLQSSVSGLDVLSRAVDPASGLLRSRRLMQTEWGLPAWATALVGLDRPCYVAETSEVDAASQTFTLKSRNLTFASFVSIDERLTYRPHPALPDQTLLTQEAVITVRGVPLTAYCEGVVESHMFSNAGKGRTAMEWVIAKIKAETEELRRKALDLAAEAEATGKKWASGAEDLGKKWACEAEDLKNKLANEAEDLGKKFASEAEDLGKKIANEAEDLGKKLATEAEDVSKKVLGTVDEVMAQPAGAR